jgi:hypothetical protein
MRLEGKKIMFRGRKKAAMQNQVASIMKVVTMMNAET